MLQQQFIMLHNKSQIIILLLLCVVTFQAFIELQTLVVPQIIQNQEYFGYVETQGNRMLQASITNDKTATTALKRILSDANIYRKSKGLSPLSENTNLNQIISQWSQVMRKNLQLTQYLQIYGIQNAQTQYYASIPLQYIEQVIQNISLSLNDRDYNKVGMFSNQITKNHYQVILVFQGGMSAQTITYSQDIIQSAIKNINQQIDFTGQAQSANNTKKQTVNTVNTYKPASSQITSNDSSLNQSTTNTIRNDLSQSIQQNVSNSSTPKTEQPKVINQQKPIVPNTTQVQQKPVLVQSPPKPSVSQPPKVTQNPQTISPNSSNQVTNTTLVVVTTPPSVVAPSTPSPTSNNQVLTPKTPSNIPSEVLLNNQTSKTSSIVKYTPRTIPSKQSTNKSDSFPNINLYHNVPTTFLKNEIFPFKGSITVPNPSGRQVNIILTRISDQQRLPFSQYLSPNQTQFYILANMNMTGDYYISIFVGNSGLTSLTQYTIAPSAIGPFSSKPPNPIQTASLNLIGNSLWLYWNSSDSNPPAITQIIFSQDNGQSIQFIISNYQKTFKIPYRLFYAFNQGVTNIQVSQAYSLDQSASSRSSAFSAPFNIIFNATTHNYDTFGASNTFEPISLKYPKGSNIVITGAAGAQLQNQVYLITPSKVFETYYLTPNSSIKYIQKGTLVNLTINLNETGVYIFQINNSGGEALINIPLYVGDIYPLLPDFMDLSPTYIDLAALNQPTLLSDRRSLVLQLINNIRNAYGAANIYLDNNLNSLAQNYSLTQIQGNFIGHIDRQGRTPSQRAMAARIYQGVGENIAMNNNLTNAQLMLQRSPAHLKNMVNPAWTRVGLGILQNSNQFYYLTQQFSSRDFTLYPLTNSEINGIEDNIVNFIISNYPFLVGEDKVLSSKLSAYQSMDDRPYIITYLQGQGYRNLAVANLQVSYNGGNYINLIKSGTSFEPTSTLFRQLGITVTYTNGMLQIFVAYI